MIAEKESTLEIRVRWNELDSNHHVNNSFYMNYFDEARMSALEELGFSLAKMREMSIGPVIYKTEIEFKKPLHHPETAIVKTHFENSVKFRSECVQTIIRKSDGQEVCKARFYCMFFNTATGKPHRLSPEERERLT